MPATPSMRRSSQPSGTITATATTEPGRPYPIVAVRAAIGGGPGGARPHPVCEQQRHHRHQHRAHPGEQDAVARGGGELGGEQPVPDRLHRPHAELGQRRGHHQPDQRERQDHRGRGREPAQAHGPHDVAARRELGVARAPAREALEHEQRERDRHEQHGELHRRVAVERVEPDAVDRVRERPHPEQVDRAEVGERLHQRERDAAEDRRPRERQAHAQDRPAAREPEPARGLEQRARLAEERRPRQQVDVRVEHEREHADRPERGADAGQVEPEREQREHVAGHRERQHERPLDPAPPRELEEGHERGERGAEQEGARPHAHQDEGRGLDRLGEEAGEARERAGGDDERERQADERPCHEHRAEDRADGEAIERLAPQSHPTWSIRLSASVRCAPAPSTSIGSCLKWPNWAISFDGRAPSTTGNSWLFWANTSC